MYDPGIHGGGLIWFVLCAGVLAVLAVCSCCARRACTKRRPAVDPEKRYKTIDCHPCYLSGIETEDWASHRIKCAEENVGRLRALPVLTEEHCPYCGMALKMYRNWEGWVN